LPVNVKLVVKTPSLQLIELRTGEF